MRRHRGSPDEVLAIVSGLTPDQFERPTVNTGWSVKDTLAHLATIPLRNVDMWRHALEGRAWTGEASVDDYSLKRVTERRSWSGQQVVDEYRQTMTDQIAFLQQLNPADADCEWDHPAASLGRTTLLKMASGGPPHHRKHGSEIRAATAD